MTSDAALPYFAYGSNMLSLRLQARVPSARALGIGSLTAHALRWHMPSSDGSAKCDALLTGLTADRVWGVLFELLPSERVHLDRAEGLGHAYARSTVEIELGSTMVQAFIYRALRIGPVSAPYHWYREFVLRGAREHRLPPGYLETIESVTSIADTDAERHALNEAIYLGTSR